MKTKNNVQKTMLRFGAVVISFVLVSYTVSAQGFWERFLESSSFGHLASGLVGTKTTLPNAARVEIDELGIHFETALEADLELEPWMMDETRFLQSAGEASVSDTIEPTDVVFQKSTYHVYAAPETEARLEIERWMVADRVWGK